MNVKYHISPTTGNPNKCYATKQCPFGGAEAHYVSKNEARAAYEQANSQDSLSATSKKEKLANSGVVYSFPEDQLEAAKNSIAKANRRLEKFGIEDRFTFTVEAYDKEVPPPNGFMPAFSTPYVRFTLKTPAISYGGHRFLAVVEAEEEGLMTRTASDVELYGWRPTSMACEHCGQNRPRSKTFLVENKDGERKQIGSTCVEGYLGVKPEGLWALGSDPVEKFEREPVSAPSRYTVSQPVDYTIAVALAVSDGGDNFVSKSQAYDLGLTPTAERVEDVIWGAKNLSPEDQRAYIAKADEYIASGKVDEVIATIQGVDGDTDYATNLRTVAAGDWVRPKNTAILVSGLTAYRRQQTVKKEAGKPKATPGFAAPVKAKVSGLKATVTGVRHRDDVDNWGNPVVKTQLVFRDEAGHEMIWWASKKINANEGASITFTGGTVKAHRAFRDTDQTVLTRVKMEEASE